LRVVVVPWSNARVLEEFVADRQAWRLEFFESPWALGVCANQKFRLQSDDRDEPEEGFGGVRFALASSQARDDSGNLETVLDG
jgi:hypothetical protein